MTAELRVADYTAECYARKGMWTQAASEMAQHARIAEPRGVALMAFMFARAGRTAEAERVLESFVVGRSRYEAELAGEIATVYAGLGSRDSAFAWLERARNERTLVLDDLPLVLDALQPDPRVESLRHRLRLGSR